MGKFTKRRKIAEKNGETPHTHQKRIQLLKNKHIEDLCDLESQLRREYELELGSGKVSKASYEKLIQEIEEKDKIIEGLKSNKKSTTEPDEKDEIINELESEKTKIFDEKEEILDKYRDLQVVFIDIVKHETYKVNRFYVLSEIAKLHCEDDTLEVLNDHVNNDKDEKHTIHNNEPELSRTATEGFKKRFTIQKHFKDQDLIL